MAELRPGDVVELAVRRGDERRTFRLKTIASDRERRAVVGVGVQQAADFDFPIDVDINAGDVGGPSAGLAFALDVVDELGPTDLDGGRRIVVTGELELDGDVLAIGGIKQKTIGARDAGADLFVVPNANAREARKYAGGLEILGVATFEETLSHLTKGEFPGRTTASFSRLTLPQIATFPSTRRGVAAKERSYHPRLV